MSGPKPKVKKIPPKLTPEEVAANESMKPNKFIATKGRPKAKDLHHNTKQIAKTNTSRPEPLFVLDIKTMRQRPVSIAYLEQLANKLINWVNTKKEIIIDDFLQQEGYSYSTFKRFRNRCPKLEEAYQYTKMCIGNKRERDGLHNKMNTALVMKTMAGYSDRWKELDEWRSRLNKEENEAAGDKIIVIKEAADTGIPKAPESKDNKDDAK